MNAKTNCNCEICVPEVQADETVESRVEALLQRRIRQHETLYTRRNYATECMDTLFSPVAQG